MTVATEAARARRAPHPGSEVRRALIATALGVGLGALVALFSQREGRR
ncbi:MAG TPA: hypothetical protein VGB52_04715 [Actinomycetota bacterium]|jgi:hypothetical protein